MSTVQLKFGPADHNRPLTLDDFESAEYERGFKYEIIDGRLYVSPLPNPPENILESESIARTVQETGSCEER